MESFDRAGEYLRLRDQYRGLSDGELLNLARQSSELTEIAQQTLASEISYRRLQPKPDEPPSSRKPEPPPDITDPNDPKYDEDRQLVSICTVWSLADALQLQSLLDAASIPFYLGAEKATNVNAVTATFTDGVDVQIMSIGVPWARVAMKDYTPADDRAHEKEKVLDEASVRCPKCHSSEVVLEETDPVREGASFQWFKWTCDKCGHHWEDDGVEAAQ